MATLKYSRQRECIRDFVQNCHEHPTADNVYAGIKEEFPNISLGTVYRNLSLLVELGEIAKISTGNGPGPGLRSPARSRRGRPGCCSATAPPTAADWRWSTLPTGGWS